MAAARPPAVLALPVLLLLLLLLRVPDDTCAQLPPGVVWPFPFPPPPGLLNQVVAPDGVAIRRERRAGGSRAHFGIGTPPFGFLLDGSSVPGVNGIYGPRLPHVGPDGVEQDVPEALKPLLHLGAYRHDSSGWWLVSLRDAGESAEAPPPSPDEPEPTPGDGEKADSDGQSRVGAKDSVENDDHEEDGDDGNHHEDHADDEVPRGPQWVLLDPSLRFRFFRILSISHAFSSTWFSSPPSKSATVASSW